MKQADIIVIGGSAAGLVAATTAKSTFPEKRVVLFRKEDTVMIPCGIPYIFGTLESSEQNILPDKGLLNLDVEIIVNTIESIDAEAHTVQTATNDVYQYEKLILATGSTPVKPKSIKGASLHNVFTVKKDKHYLDHLAKVMKPMKKIAIIGAGFIGVEMADEIAKTNTEVVIIESLPQILGGTFDEETCRIAEEVLQKDGVEILTNTRVEGLIGDSTVEAVKLIDGTTIAVDGVILAVGYRPNAELAKTSGISVNKQGAIKVDAYLRTHQKDIFACGDCAQKRDFITGKITNTMLASTACAEARIAAMNLYELNTIRTFNGTIGIYSTNIGGVSFGVAGISERKAREEGFAIETASFKGIDRHPGKLHDAHYQYVKLIVNRNSGLIVGGEVVGGSSIGELTNVLGFIIQNKMIASDVLCSQIGTQPMLTASPAAYPLFKAAELVLRKIK